MCEDELSSCGGEEEHRSHDFRLRSDHAIQHVVATSNSAPELRQKVGHESGRGRRQVIRRCKSSDASGRLIGLFVALMHKSSSI